MGAGVSVLDREVVQDRSASTPRLVHLGVTLDGRPPRLAVCGAPVSYRAHQRDPDCVVCAEILRGLERGVGE